MKVLVYSPAAHGPAMVFLPPAKGKVPDSAAVPADDRLLAPARAQVASMGPRATWPQHCQLLVSSPPYAGTWAVQDVPDGYPAAQALAYVRQQDSDKAMGVQPGEPQP